MRIGIDASRANLRKRTGTEWYSLEIIRNIILRHPEDNFVLYVKEAPVEELTDLGPNVEIRILRWPPKLLWNQLRLSIEMLLHAPDVLFVPAHTIPIIHPRQTVVTIHDLGFEQDPELYGASHIGGRGIIGGSLDLAARLVTLGRYGNSELDYHRWSARFAARTASHIITISNFTRDELATKYHVPLEKMSVIYHGFNPEVFKQPDSARIEAVQTDFHLTKPYLLFIGRLERKKNIVTLIKVFTQLHAKHDLDLVLIGQPGTGWSAAEEIIHSHHLEDAIHLLGWQPNDVYVPLLAGAQALVFISLFEGFGLPVLEAFAVGTPVVASNVTAIPEVAADAAILVDPNNLDSITAAIESILSSSEIRKKFVARGRLRTLEFTWAKAADETHAILISKGD